MATAPSTPNTRSRTAKAKETEQLVADLTVEVERMSEEEALRNMKTIAVGDLSYTPIAWCVVCRSIVTKRLFLCDVL